MIRAKAYVWAPCIVALLASWWALDTFLGFDRLAAVLIGVALAATLGVIAARAWK